MPLGSSPDSGTANWYDPSEMTDAQPDPARFSPTRLDASEQIALELRRYIERQELKPGDRVGTEQELAAEFGVSRPTLREALRLLAGSHLLRVDRGRSGGIFVAGTPTQGLGRALSASIATLVAADSVGLRQLLEVRALLEGGVAALAAERADEAALVTLAASVDEVERSQAGTARFGRAAVRFHRVLAEAAGNDLLVAFTGWILDVLLPKMGEELCRGSTGRRSQRSTGRCSTRFGPGGRKRRSARCARTSPRWPSCSPRRRA